MTIHRQDCANILHLTDEEQRRLIEVAWTGHANQSSASSDTDTMDATLNVLAFDRKGLLRDVMSVLTDWDINLIHSDTHTDKADGTVSMTLGIELAADCNMGAFLDQLEQVKNIVSSSMNLNQQVDSD